MYNSRSRDAWTHMRFLGTLTNIQANILLCNRSSSSTNDLVGCIVYIYNKNEYVARGIVFEISTNVLKILLLEGNASDIKINNNVYTIMEGLSIPVGFNILGENIDPSSYKWFYNAANSSRIRVTKKKKKNNGSRIRFTKLDAELNQCVDNLMEFELDKQKLDEITKDFDELTKDLDALWRLTFGASKKK